MIIWCGSNHSPGRHLRSPHEKGYVKIATGVQKEVDQALPIPQRQGGCASWKRDNLVVTHRKLPVPLPARPDQRKEPLPWHQPKSSEEDPHALDAVRAIRESSTYRLAEQDFELLARPDLRGPRLEIEYLKADVTLAEQGIDHTIIVYGSTRIPEPTAARRNVEAARMEVEQRPKDRGLRIRLHAAERILAKSFYYDVARDLGRLIGEVGPYRVVVMTGGGPGIMEAANRGAFDVGAKSIGLNIELPHEQYPNPYVTPGLCFRFRYFALRKMHLLLRAKALVAFPGGYGTLDELFEVLTLIQTRKINPIPVILVGTNFWRRAVDFDYLMEEGVIDLEDRELFWFAESAREIWDGIRNWYEATRA